MTADFECLTINRSSLVAAGSTRGNTLKEDSSYISAQQEVHCNQKGMLPHKGVRIKPSSLTG